jgi:hypothetical protein
MYPRVSRILLLAFVLLLLPCASLAKDGRDFSGFYHIGNVATQGDQVAFTFQVHLFNHSDADLNHAVVTLRSAQHTLAPLAQFQAGKLWRNGGELKLAQAIVISKDEYERWQRGAQPTVMVVYHDGSGHRWERFVQVSIRPGLEQ